MMTFKQIYEAIVWFLFGVSPKKKPLLPMTGEQPPAKRLIDTSPLLDIPKPANEGTSSIMSMPAPAKIRPKKKQSVARLKATDFKKAQRNKREAIKYKRSKGKFGRSQK